MSDREGTQREFMVIPGGKVVPVNPPEDDDACVWRYMDFPRFAAMLEHEALWLSRADCLGDQFEGSLPEPNFLRREALYRELKMRDWSDTRQQIPKRTFVSCWHLSEHESAAMWSLYAADGKGIAIRSTYRKLRDAFQGEGAFIGCVRYIDYTTDVLREGPIQSPFFHKRSSFKYEQELRVVVMEFPLRSRNEVDTSAREAPTAIPRSVDLARLIDQVYVGPLTPDWFRDLTERVLRNRCPKKVVCRTALDANALF